MRKIFFLLLLCYAGSFLKAATQTDSIPVYEPEIFDRAEVMPAFPGGVAELLRFVSKYMDYPEKARKMNAEGKVIVKFYVDTDGYTKDPVVIADNVGYGCAKEAINVINLMPKWTPGSQKGKLVKVYYTLPITFKLQ